MNKQRIFIDMDGVLAVFKETDKIETLYEKKFFLNLKPQKNVVEMVGNLQDNPEYEIFILSAYLTDSKYAKTEKIQWLNQYLPDIDTEHILFCPCGEDKNKYVPNGICQSDILLDDYTPNLMDWKNAGGIAIKIMNGINGTKGTWQGAKLNIVGKYDHAEIILIDNLYKLINALNEKPDLFELIDTMMRRKALKPWQNYFESKDRIAEFAIEFRDEELISAFVDETNVSAPLYLLMEETIALIHSCEKTHNKEFAAKEKNTAMKISLEHSKNYNSTDNFKSVEDYLRTTIYSKMTIYEKLKWDLIEAAEKAKEEAIETDDGGTCNFDCCVLFLPRYNEKKTIEAIKAAGMSGFKSIHFGKVCYMLGNPIFAQGNRRTAQAEKINEVMKSKGYDTTVYYQMD